MNSDLRRRLRLLMGIVDGQVARTGPNHVRIDLTRRCNKHCHGCRYHSLERDQPAPGIDNSDEAVVMDIPFELVERLCLEFPRLDVRDVVLVGEGEPFLHPRLLDIIAAVKGAGCTVRLITNGTLIRRNNAHRLLDSGLDVLIVSLWSSSREEYVRLQPTEDGSWFDRTVEGARLVSELKVARGLERPRLLLSEALSRENYGNVHPWIDLAHGLGCNGVRFSVFRHWRGEFESQALTPEQITSVCQDLEQARARLESRSMSHNVDEILLRYRLGERAWQKLPCYAGWFHTRVQVDGTVLPCSTGMLPMGNIGQQSLEEIWNGPEYRAFRRTASTVEGLASLSEYCDCNWCVLASTNHQIHRYARRLAPLVTRNRSG